jgi:mono/diheme cytochrome c family protein
VTPVPAAPAPSTVPAPAPAAGGTDKLVFQHVILPIFEAKCNKCHNEDKSKGDLRMDTYEMAMKGGENGNNFVAGKPDDSLSLQRIALPTDDDEHMPPDGKDQLTPAEIAAIRYWVQAGASATQKISEAQFPPEAKEALPK